MDVGCSRKARSPAPGSAHTSQSLRIQASCYLMLVMAQGTERQGDWMTVHSHCQQAGEPDPEPGLGRRRAGRGLSRLNKGLFTGQEELSSRPARPCGIHPWTHNGQPVPGHLILPGLPWAWRRGQGEWREEGAVRNLCVLGKARHTFMAPRGEPRWHGQRDRATECGGQNSGPKTARILIQEIVNAAFLAKGEFRLPCPCS